jgi:hypothetical protein
MGEVIVTGQRTEYAALHDLLRERGIIPVAWLDMKRRKKGDPQIPLPLWSASENPDLPQIVIIINVQIFMNTAILKLEYGSTI